MEGVNLLVGEISSAAKSSESGDSKAKTKLRDAVKKLLLHVESPEQRIAEVKFQPLQNFALQIAMEAGVIQHLARNEGKPMSVDRIATETGANELLILRVLRVLASIAFVKEIDSLTFEANKTTMLMAEPEQIGGMKVSQDLLFPIMGQVSSILHQQGIKQFSRSGQKAPFEVVFGKAFQTWLNEHPERKNQWATSISARRSPNMPQWYQIFPVEEILKSSEIRPHAGNTLLVDLGGDKGKDAVEFKRYFSSLPGNVIVQDLPETLKEVDTSQNHGVMYLAHDFFNPQPIVGARFYYFRATLSHFNDEQVAHILKNVANSMEPGYSSLLIDDFVLPDQGVSSLAASMDLTMMMLGTGSERTVKEWQKLAVASGLEVVKIWTVEGDYEGIVECRRKAGATPSRTSTQSQAYSGNHSISGNQGNTVGNPNPVSSTVGPTQPGTSSYNTNQAQAQAARTQGFDSREGTQSFNGYTTGNNATRDSREYNSRDATQSYNQNTGSYNYSTNQSHPG